jgi:NAD(P)H-nitrite reductase large subunit
VHARIELARAAGLACERGILVDEYLRSSDEDIYAAGDVAESADPATGRRTMEVLWNSAVVKGRVAGLNMATEPVTAHERGIPLNVTRLAGLKTTIIGTVGSGGRDADLEGLQRGDSQTWSEIGDAVAIETQTRGARVRLAVGERTLAGAVVMGDQSLSFPLQDLIEARADVGSIVANLKAAGAAISELVEVCWREWKEQLA